MSIVPPPFGSGYRREWKELDQVQFMSIVPPPFGSGYNPKGVVSGYVIMICQSCRPLSGAVTLFAGGIHRSITIGGQSTP